MILKNIIGKLCFIEQNDIDIHDKTDKSEGSREEGDQEIVEEEEPVEQQQMDIPLNTFTMNLMSLKADTCTSEISEQNKLIFLLWRNNAKFVKKYKKCDEIIQEL